MDESDTRPRFDVDAVPDAERKAVIAIDHEMQLRDDAIHALWKHGEGWRVEWGSRTETTGGLTDYYPTATEAALEAQRQSLTLD